MSIIVSVAANVDEHEPPPFFVISVEEDEDGNETGKVALSGKGSVQSVCANQDFQAIYKCTVFVTMSMTISTR